MEFSTEDSQKISEGLNTLVSILKKVEQQIDDSIKMQNEHHEQWKKDVAADEAKQNKTKN